MESNLKARAFAAYLGSTAIWPGYHQNTGYDYKSGSRLVLGAASYYDAINSHSFEHIKLELTALSEITDEHCIEVAQLVGLTSHYCKIHRDEEAIFLREDTYEFQISYHMGYCCMRKNGHLYNLNIIRVIDYLRSKSYNLPFMGVNLIESGIATLKTK